MNKPALRQNCCLFSRRGEFDQIIRETHNLKMARQLLLLRVPIGKVNHTCDDIERVMDQALLRNESEVREKVWSAP